ncbi:uncharacterized protein LAESUDRAFT_497505 [Laetiporus sulphureus 93-53]|uniref:Uncharacterized protein n=1 Tax=Laetiporus sulphureus 93-53 TaxID=1314785 RepID=A0A165BH68_9APHY|nr:uncharacterized protein LAESUDRAFT_497505 [Laetiporus sulphureus 93-53]KZT01049.1 hypothetical protein LAESUDRAFT_497505 [Laetiporus sulphureus 93-53]
MTVHAFGSAGSPIVLSDDEDAAFVEYHLSEFDGRLDADTQGGAQDWETQWNERSYTNLVNDGMPGLAPSQKRKRKNTSQTVGQQRIESKARRSKRRKREREAAQMPEVVQAPLRPKYNRSKQRKAQMGPIPPVRSASPPLPATPYDPYGPPVSFPEIPFSFSASSSSYAGPPSKYMPMGAGSLPPTLPLNPSFFPHSFGMHDQPDSLSYQMPPPAPRYHPAPSTAYTQTSPLPLSPSLPDGFLPSLLDHSCIEYPLGSLLHDAPMAAPPRKPTIVKKSIGQTPAKGCEGEHGLYPLPPGSQLVSHPPDPLRTVVLKISPKKHRIPKFVVSWGKQFSETFRFDLDAKVGKALVEFPDAATAQAAFHSPRLSGDSKEHIFAWWYIPDLEEGEITEYDVSQQPSSAASQTGAPGQGGKKKNQNKRQGKKKAVDAVLQPPALSMQKLKEEEEALWVALFKSKSKPASPRSEVASRSPAPSVSYSIRGDDPDEWNDMVEMAYSDSSVDRDNEEEQAMDIELSDEGYQSQAQKLAQESALSDRFSDMKTEDGSSIASSRAASPQPMVISPITPTEALLPVAPLSATKSVSGTFDGEELVATKVSSPVSIPQPTVSTKATPAVSGSQPRVVTKAPSVLQASMAKDALSLASMSVTSHSVMSRRDKLAAQSCVSVENRQQTSADAASVPHDLPASKSKACARVPPGLTPTLLSSPVAVLFTAPAPPQSSDLPSVSFVPAVSHSSPDVSALQPLPPCPSHPPNTANSSVLSESRPLSGSASPSCSASSAVSDSQNAKASPIDNEPLIGPEQPNCPAPSKSSLSPRQREIKERIARLKAEPASRSRSVSPLLVVKSTEDSSDSHGMTSMTDAQKSVQALRRAVIRSRKNLADAPLGSAVIAAPLSGRASPTEAEVARSTWIGTSTTGNAASASGAGSSSAISPRDGSVPSRAASKSRSATPAFEVATKVMQSATMSAVTSSTAGGDTVNLDELAVVFITESIRTVEQPLPPQPPQPKAAPPMEDMTPAAKLMRLEQRIAEIKTLMAELSNARSELEKKNIRRKIREQRRVMDEADAASMASLPVASSARFSAAQTWKSRWPETPQDCNVLIISDSEDEHMDTDE